MNKNAVMRQHFLPNNAVSSQQSIIFAYKMCVTRTNRPFVGSQFATSGEMVVGPTTFGEQALIANHFMLLWWQQKGSERWLKAFLWDWQGKWRWVARIRISAKYPKCLILLFLPTTLRHLTVGNFRYGLLDSYTKRQYERADYTANAFVGTTNQGKFTKCI